MLHDDKPKRKNDDILEQPQGKSKNVLTIALIAVCSLVTLILIMMIMGGHIANIYENIIPCLCLPANL